MEVEARKWVRKTLVKKADRLAGKTRDSLMIWRNKNQEAGKEATLFELYMQLGGEAPFKKLGNCIYNWFCVGRLRRKVGKIELRNGWDCRNGGVDG